MKLIPIVALAGLLVAPTGARAACKLPSVDVPVVMEGLRPMVSAKVAGRPVKLLVDSGAFFSGLNRQFAEENKLKSPAYMPTGSHLHADVDLTTSGAAGVEHQTVIVTATMELGGSNYHQIDFVTHPLVLGGAAGLLGQNFLHGADADYDFKAGRIRFLRPTDCAQTDLAYWVKSGESYSVLPLETNDSRVNQHTRVTVEINGVKMRAYFDTGAPNSFITARAASRAGVKTTDPEVKAAGVGHGTDGDLKMWIGPFASIKIGDEEVKNTQLAIGDSKAEAFDVLIGADFFMAHHVLVANSQGKIYFSYLGGPIFKRPAD